MQELLTAEEVAGATDGLLVRWGAQALTPEYPHEAGAAWLHGSAVAVYAPKLCRYDRLLFSGPVDDAAELLARVIPMLRSDRFRPLATAGLAEDVAARIGLQVRASFGWMHLAAEPPTAPTPDVEWLTAADEDAIASLLRKANPGSYLFPDDPGARRWAGIRAADGALLAVGGDSWPAPGLRLISGVATHPDHRGGGLSTMLCTFLTRELAPEGAVALMADADNEPARRVYRGLGYRYRSVTALAG
ncbi:GNAT family N-acetyltransferase [Saccharopolyspora spinosa]|uniref:FR47-like protein n=1 Tax=Saccharopolyspora spinosa TaxID=60894 RepID=A0A2N3XTU8_SACSN|nr:GNAT family N-acetyltransferase [Saccharopolyspora spinosa]PKW14062.1 FR47-like protein [Saccharopolyspora spinosa]